MNMNAQVYDQYRKTSVETLTPAKLLLMLYDGALKSMRTAQKAIQEKDMNLAHNQLVKAQDIIIELMTTLNMEYQVSHQLYALYDYLHQRLIEANMTKDTAIINEVCQFVSEIRETFAQAANLAGRNAGQVTVREFSIKG